MSHLKQFFLSVKNKHHFPDVRIFVVQAQIMLLEGSQNVQMFLAEAITCGVLTQTLNGLFLKQQTLSQLNPPLKQVFGSRKVDLCSLGSLLANVPVSVFATNTVSGVNKLKIEPP